MLLTDESPMLLNTAGQSDLLANLRASRRRQLDLRKISLHTEHTPTSRRRTDVDEKQLVFDEF